MKTASKRWVWPLVAGWVGLVALMSSPSYTDPASVTLLYVDLLLVPLPALVLGFALGRVHAWRALAVSCAAATAMPLIKAVVTAGIDPAVSMDTVFDFGAVLLPLFLIPLVAGGTCGVFCRALRQP